MVDCERWVYTMSFYVTSCLHFMMQSDTITDSQIVDHSLAICISLDKACQSGLHLMSFTICLQVFCVSTIDTANRSEVGFRLDIRQSLSRILSCQMSHIKPTSLQLVVSMVHKSGP